MSGQNHTGFSLSYKITNSTYNKILGAQIDEKNHCLSLTLDVTKSGTLSISVPRALLDSQMHNQDVPFVILKDGYEVRYNETIDHRKGFDNSIQDGSKYYGDSNHTAGLIR